jgi:hypothetical protein
MGEMNLKTIFTGNLLTFLLLMAFACTSISAQDTTKAEVHKSRLYAGFTIGPAMNKIINVGELSVSALSSKVNYSVSGSLDLGYQFSEIIGLSTGLVYSTNSSELSLNSYSNKFNTTDSENEPYECRVDGSSISEIQKISFLSIPLCINFQFPFTKRFGMFIQAGVNFSFPVSQEYSSSGTFTYTGYYPAYNVILKNLPAYGFIDDASLNYKGKLDIISPVINGLGMAGFQLFVTEKLQLALGANYCRSLMNISKYTSPETFQLSSDISKIYSMMGGCSNVTTQNVGLRLSFRYYFR